MPPRLAEGGRRPHRRPGRAVGDARADAGIAASGSRTIVIPMASNRAALRRASPTPVIESFIIFTRSLRRTTEWAWQSTIPASAQSASRQDVGGTSPRPKATRPPRTRTWWLGEDPLSSSA